MTKRNHGERHYVSNSGACPSGGMETPVRVPQPMSGAVVVIARQCEGGCSALTGSRLRRWVLLPEFLGVDAIFGAACGVLVAQERRPADEVDG